MDDELSKALAMSMGDNVDMNAVLGNLPGVDPNDPRLQSALEQDKKKQKKEDPESKK